MLLDRVFLGFRIALGLIFFIFGLNGFLGFIPILSIENNLSVEQGKFISALKGTTFFFPLLNSLQVISGSLLMLNLFSPFILLALLPITVNIFLFHYFLGAYRELFNQEMFFPSFIVLLHVTLLLRNLRLYKNLFLSVPKGKHPRKK